ncbi:MAG TPA: OsmC family protein [Thermotogota bacterium]|nr:OsmC family protein [Thermotogota bacterium]HPJ87969.1 OsmC family protein [Thermotogota bacterium]HPR95056.1 OsmC family protein [Thermotogota bacterium]
MGLTTEWKGNMEFLAKTESGHDLIMDASETSGGQDKGVRPKELLLVGLTGCSGMDVVSILKKMKVENYSFKIDVEYEKTTEHPVIYSKIHLLYKFMISDDKDREKIEKAVRLSQDRYCGVSAMLKASSEVTYEIIYE